MAQSSIRNLNIDGNLVISGSTTQLDVNTIVVDDNNITINDVTTPTDANANQGGLTLKGSTDKTINWVDANDAWTLSEHLDIADTKEYRINNVSVLNATTLGSSVINSSLTNLGTLTGLTVDNIRLAGSGIGILTDLDLITLGNTTVTVAGAVYATTFHGNGNALTNLNTSSFVAPGSNSNIIINSSGALGAISTVPLAQGGTGGTDAATARTSLGVTATGADTAYNLKSNNLSDVPGISTARTNLGLGTGDSPTFGHAGGHGAVTVESFPVGATLKTAGLLQRSIPPAAGTGHRFFTGIGDGIGSFTISHKVTSDAGVDSGTASVYFWTRDTGKKVYVGGTYPSSTTTNAYINGLAYPTADGSNGQVITTDGNSVLSFTSVSGIGALLASNNLSDVSSAATSRTNLGLGTAATQNSGVFAQVANNLSDVTAATARTNLGITATGADTAYAFRANNLSDVTAATARTNLGITATGADTAYAFRANNLSDLANAATSRTNLGLGTIATQAANAVNIDGGAIDGVTVGANSAQPATVTTFTSTGIDDNASSTAMTIASNQDTTFSQGIKVGNLAGAAGAGNIRWSGTDFHGHNGTEWVSLTSAATASISGNIATFTATQAITSTSYVDVPGYTTAITVTNSNIINVQVNVDLTGPDEILNIKLVRVVGGTPTDLYIDESGSSAAGTSDHLNIVYADAHGQSNGTVITYKLMAKVDGGTLTVNPDATNAQIFVYEITTSPTSVTSVWGQTGDVTSADWGSVA
jgi:hypothetical protein